jgi:Heterokaryon incompatibility protein (HET)
VPELESLSYTWGSPEVMGSIFVDSHVLFITKNLKAALLELRKMDKGTVL